MSKTQRAKASQSMNLDDVGIVGIVFKSMFRLLNALRFKKKSIQYLKLDEYWGYSILFNFLTISTMITKNYGTKYLKNVHNCQ